MDDEIGCESNIALRKKIVFPHFIPSFLGTALIKYPPFYNLYPKFHLHIYSYQKSEYS